MAIKSFFFFLTCILLACQPLSSQGKAERITQSFIKTLKTLHSRQDILEKKGRIRRHYSELIEQGIHSEGQAPINNRYAEALKQELIRVYALPEGRKIMESCQLGALEKLKTFEEKNRLKR